MFREISIDSLSIHLQEELNSVFGIFKSLGLLEKNNNGWKITEKGKLRVEEMSYYIEALTLKQKLTASKCEFIPLHCFSTRSKEQLNNWIINSNALLDKGLINV
jgi:hypothetical protein